MGLNLLPICPFHSVLLFLFWCSILLVLCFTLPCPLYIISILKSLALSSFSLCTSHLCSLHSHVPFTLFYASLLHPTSLSFVTVFYTFIYFASLCHLLALWVWNGCRMMLLCGRWLVSLPPPTHKDHSRRPWHVPVPSTSKACAQTLSLLLYVSIKLCLWVNIDFNPLYNCVLFTQDITYGRINPFNHISPIPYTFIYLLLFTESLRGRWRFRSHLSWYTFGLHRKSIQLFIRAVGVIKNNSIHFSFLTIISCLNIMHQFSCGWRQCF